MQTQEALIELRGDGGASHDQSRDEGAKESFAPAAGLSQTFPDRYASRVRGRDDLTSGYGSGFQTAEFLPIVASKQVRQSETPLKIVCKKTLRQAQNSYIESFNARLRDELLDGEIFYSLREAQIIIKSWWRCRPRSGGSARRAR